MKGLVIFDLRDPVFGGRIAIFNRAEIREVSLTGTVIGVRCLDWPTTNIAVDVGKKVDVNDLVTVFAEMVEDLVGKGSKWTKFNDGRSSVMTTANVRWTFMRDTNTWRREMEPTDGA